MRKTLSEMSLEELWQLFPIVLTEHQEVWEKWYLDEQAFLKGILPQTAKIHHIGSTAIPRIWAKPIVDILVEIPTESNLREYEKWLVANGYICMSQGETGLSFNKGYTENGFAERVFHLHVRFAGDNEELYFRDYLTQHPNIANEYEKLKLSLWKEYEHNRDGYTNAKTQFVKKHTEQAKRLYGNRY